MTNKECLLSCVLKHWPRVNFPVEITPVLVGATNQVYHIDDGKKCYYLKSYRRNLQSALNREHHLLNTLSTELPQVLKPIKTHLNGDLVCWEGHFYALFPEAKGEMLESFQLSCTHAREAGIYLARLHNALRAINVTDFPKMKLCWNGKEWCERLQRILASVLEVESPDNVDRWAIERIREQYDYLNRPDSWHHYVCTTEEQVIHGDFHHYNLFFGKDGQVSEVIDWDLAQRMPVGYEIARACWYMFRLDLAKTKAFIEGYLSISVLSLERLRDGANAWAIFADHHIWALEAVYLHGNQAAKKFIPEQPFEPFLSSWNKVIEHVSYLFEG
ncbi:phosphotransferase [Vibrio fluvialis]